MSEDDEYDRGRKIDRPPGQIPGRQIQMPDAVPDTNGDSEIAIVDRDEEREPPRALKSTRLGGPLAREYQETVEVMQRLTTLEKLAVVRQFGATQISLGFENPSNRDLTIRSALLVVNGFSYKTIGSGDVGTGIKSGEFKLLSFLFDFQPKNSDVLKKAEVQLRFVGGWTVTLPLEKLDRE